MASLAGAISLMTTCLAPKKRAHRAQVSPIGPAPMMSTDFSRISPAILTEWSPTASGSTNAPS